MSEVRRPQSPSGDSDAGLTEIRRIHLKRPRVSGYGYSVSVRQYVYLSLFSTDTTAAQMAAVIGIEPDSISVRAARIPEMDLPRRHRWNVECRESGLAVDEQIARVVSRVNSQLSRIAELINQLEREDPPGGAVLQVVRYFNENDGGDEGHRENISKEGLIESEDISGQKLLGWHLSQDVLEFLMAVHAELDVDEYD